MRGEFETRALHLQPSEIIIAGDLSNATKKVLSHLSINTYPLLKCFSYSRHSSSEAVRVEYVARPKTLDTAQQSISSFYQSNPSIPASLLEKILSFPRLTLLSLSALLTYIHDFGLQNVFTSKYFTHFSSRASMLLNGSTISSLEIYRNQTDFSKKGSLLWVLDHTRTKFGRRMLRKWIGRPLLAKQYFPVGGGC
jgi:DNA mismatch repair protein MSH3